MDTHYVSDEWELGLKGHKNFDFVDVNLLNDNLLFIDPCLLEGWQSSWAKKASLTMHNFFTELFKAYQENSHPLKIALLCHSGEQNATKLGYGRGDNGKGNTAMGLIHDFKPLERLIHEINTIGVSQDIPVLIPGFAEDGMSDLLTNIIHDKLNEFTLEQMRLWKIEPNGTGKFWSWNMETSQWQTIDRPCYVYKGKEFLLVPKKIVRKNFLFGTGQYFGRIILERYRVEQGLWDGKGKPLPKLVVARNIQRDEKHWMYGFTIDYTKQHPDALMDYHNRMQSFYGEYGMGMTDDDLDAVIYQAAIQQAS